MHKILLTTRCIYRGMSVDLLSFIVLLFWKQIEIKYILKNNLYQKQANNLVQSPSQKHNAVHGRGGFDILHWHLLLHKFGNAFQLQWISSFADFHRSGRLIPTGIRLPHLFPPLPTVSPQEN